MRETVVQFAVRRILPDVRKLELEGIVFIEEFKVPLPLLSHGWIVGVKRQLGRERFREAERQ
jgi:hypothetical protein